MRRLGDRGTTLLTIGLIAIYLSGMTWLALTVDRRFFVNDAVSVVLWLSLGVGLAVAGHRASRTR